MKKGFTLAEVAVAVVVMGILLIPLLSLLGTDIVNDAKIRDKGFAYELAQEEIEWLLHSKVPTIALMTYFVSEDEGGNSQIETIQGRKQNEEGEWVDTIEVKSTYQTTFSNREWLVKRNILMDSTLLTEIQVNVYYVHSPDKPLASLFTFKYQ